jgi:hypothetical protein
VSWNQDIVAGKGSQETPEKVRWTPWVAHVLVGSDETTLIVSTNRVTGASSTVQLLSFPDGFPDELDIVVGPLELFPS